MNKHTQNQRCSGVNKKEEKNTDAKTTLFLNIRFKMQVVWYENTQIMKNL
jgi:hypothetical protein